MKIGEAKRFEFGANWARFLKVLNEERILLAEQSLRTMVGINDLTGRTFIDIGCGSGLFSLAARRMGARVHSFDFDHQSVACTKELKHRYFNGDANWTIEQGSVLDNSYLESLGQWDVVYSWGVLHHTGAMWQALENVTPLVQPSGTLFIAIYNNQGFMSSVWLEVKQLYISLPRGLRWIVLIPALIGLRGPRAVLDIARGKPLQTWNQYARISARGMSSWYDLVDWVGGYPFEVAKPEEILDFYLARGFALKKLTTCGGKLGCNQFVLKRLPSNLSRHGTDVAFVE